MIGPTKMKENMKKAQELSRPDSRNLALLLEPDIFTSEIMDEVCLFPKPMNKFQRMAEQNAAAAGKVKEVTNRSRMATNKSMVDGVLEAMDLSTSITQ